MFTAKVKWILLLYSNPAEVYHFSVKMFVENNENKQKEAVIGPFFKKKLFLITFVPTYCVEIDNIFPSWTWFGVWFFAWEESLGGKNCAVAHFALFEKASQVA